MTPLILFSILLVLLFLFPFMAGMRELGKKADVTPLFINMDYAKDPRYFGQSFRKVLLSAIAKFNCPNGVHFLNISKQEATAILDSAKISSGEVLSEIYYVKQDLTSDYGASFEKEVYVRGNATIGEKNALRAMACDGDAHIGSGTTFVRWLDVEKNIVVGEKCDLGVSASCSGHLLLAPGCSFKRLYGFPVAAGAAPALAPEQDTPASVDASIREAAAASPAAGTVGQPDDGALQVSEEVVHNIRSVPHHSQYDCSIITNRSLIIEEHAIVKGHVKTYGSLATGADVIITGNVFAEGDVHLGPGSRVNGTIFTQGCVILDEGVTIGSPTRTKTVVGKKGVEIHRAAIVYGYVMTEGEGTVA